MDGLDVNTINLIFMALIFGVVYFFMIMPARKREEAQKDFQGNLSKGDEVVTASGIIGRINKIEDNELTLETANKTYLRMTRNSISKDMTNAVFGEKE